MGNVFLDPTRMAILHRDRFIAAADRSLAPTPDRRFDVREAVMAKIPTGATVTIWSLCADLRAAKVTATFTEVSVAVGELVAAGRLTGCASGYRRKT